jgi:hypothetical protein
MVALVTVSLRVEANDSSAAGAECTLGPPDPRWIAAWGATPDILQIAPANSSVRNISRISATGTEVRVRVANPRSGSTLLVIGSASIAPQQGRIGADVVPGSITAPTVDGNPGTTIPRRLTPSTATPCSSIWRPTRLWR